MSTDKREIEFQKQLEDIIKILKERIKILKENGKRKENRRQTKKQPK